MTLKVIQDYTQKSRIFLYPALEIKREVSISPIQTYVSWDNQYEVEDSKLICLYHLRNDEKFKSFEKFRLRGNKFFHDFKFTDDDKGVYIFDLTSKKKDWDHIIQGRYSKISQEHKKLILEFFRKSPHLAYIESFLYPGKYFQIYSEILNVKEVVLREVGELCPKPDLEKEMLIIPVKDLDIINNPVNLH